MLHTESSFFQKKYTTPVAYLVGLLLFFLPFVQVKCNNVPFAENTGLGLAFGTDYKVTSQPDLLETGFKAPEVTSSTENGKLYISALIALILGVGGLVISLSTIRLRFLIGMVSSLAVAFCLAILMIQISSDVKTGAGEIDADEPITDAVKVTVEYTFWYYLSIASFIIASFFAYKQKIENAKSISKRAVVSDKENKMEEAQHARITSGAAPG